MGNAVHVLPPADYNPAATSTQPSSSWVDPVRVAMVPGGQAMSRPPMGVVVVGEYLPHSDRVHPSVAVVDPKMVAYSPAAHVIGVQLLTVPPLE